MLIRRLRYWLGADKRDTDLRTEIEQHLCEKVVELRAMGRSDTDANAEARRLFRNPGLKQEASRQIWIARYWSEFWQDLRYGSRLLTRSPGSTVVMIFALALGIGVNTAVFTAYKVIIDRQLDARAPEEMVNIAMISNSGVIDERFSYQDYEAYRDSLRSFRGLIAFRNSQITFSEAARNQGPADSRAGLVSVAVVSENYFDVLGRALLQGRTFGSMTSAGLVATPAVLITENYWERRFARAPSILGRTIYLNGAPVVVAGITPRDLIGTSQQAPTFWVPATLKLGLYTSLSSSPNRGDKQYRLFGRLAPGVTIAQAQAEVTSVYAQLRILNSTPVDPIEPATAVVWPGSPFPRPIKSEPGIRLVILLIMVAAGSVLAVACANVGGLRLARARARENELRTRLALGASRFRVVRQLLTESSLSGLVAGALAFFLSWVIFRVSLIFIANTMPVDQGTLVFDVAPDLEAFVYAFAVSQIAGVLSGLGPAMEGSRAAISSSTRSTTLTAGGRRLQNLLVSVQVALSVVLLIVGAVAIRSSVQSLVADTGYETQRVFELNFRFPETAEYTDTRKAVLVAQLRAQTSAQPGVTAVTSALPPGISAFQTTATAVMETSPEGASRILYYSHVQTNYFKTLGIPITRGRGFAPEAGQPEHSVVLNEAASKQFWPGENPVGRRLRLGALDERARSRGELFADVSAGQVYEVAGVVGNTRGREIDGSNSEQIYVPLAEEKIQNYPLLVRTTSNPIQVIRGIDPLVSAIDSNIVVSTTTLEELRRLSPAFLIPSIAAAVASTVGLFALLLAVMGIYGTVSYICVLCTREVGIRLALGAQKRDVVRLMLRESAQPVLIGLSVGILLAAATSYLAQGLLFGLHGADIFAFIGVSALFLAIALLASYLPTLRVIRIDPVVALRHE